MFEKKWMFNVIDDYAAFVVNGEVRASLLIYTWTFFTLISQNEFYLCKMLLL